jgi:hypothetical protein
MELDQKKIDELKAAHPGAKLHQLTPEGHDAVFVVKPPTRAQWKRFRTESQDTAKRATAIETLCLDCVVHPPRAEFEQLLERLPGMAASLAGEIAEIAGTVEKFEKKEL